MKLKCECGWEGEIWDAAITLGWDEARIDCPACKSSVKITTKTETRLQYVITDADGTSRYADIPELAK